MESLSTDYLMTKNMESWKSDLPKADYETLSEKPADEIMHPKFGNVSQNRLREIVRVKNEELSMLKKENAKRINPENLQAIRQPETAKQIGSEKAYPTDKNNSRK